MCVGSQVWVTWCFCSVQWLAHRGVIPSCRTTAQRDQVRATRSARSASAAAGLARRPAPRRPGRPGSTPTPRRARASRASRPAPARPARCRAAAPPRRPRPRRSGTLPARLEKSKAPSPVTHQVGRPGPLGQVDRVGDQRRPRARGWRPGPAARSPDRPAAPAPGSSDSRRSTAAAYCSSQPSTTGSRSSAMPFCGP